jgi:hypothetical protein
MNVFSSLWHLVRFDKRPTLLGAGGLELLASFAMLTSLVLGAVLPKPAQAMLSPNLLTNGGFDSGSLAPWTLDYGDVDVVANYPSGWQTSDGSAYSLDLNGFHPAGIAQSFSTVPGLTYQALFALSKNPGATNGATLDVWTGTSHASPDALQSYSFTASNSTSAMGWVQETFNFTANSNTTTLHFWSTTTGPLCLNNQFAACGPALDNIRVPSLDTTPPAAAPTQTPAANGAGWNNTDVTVAWNWTDAGSGIDPANCTTSSTSSGESSAIVLTASCADNAGNTGHASYNVKVDKTAPSITATAAPAANGNGWNNTDVTVTFTCADGLSGVASCPAPATVSAEGATTVSGTATDNAGNSASTSVVVKLDKTPPTVSVSGPATVIQGSSSSATVTASDALSGLAVDPSGSLALDTSTPGSKTVTVTATDNAGNSGSASFTYTVWSVTCRSAPVEKEGKG